MTIPENTSITACADLSKSYSAPKEEPMEASIAAVENQIENPTSPSNHELLVKTWVMTSLSTDDTEILNGLPYPYDLQFLLSRECLECVYDADGNCTTDANGAIITDESCIPFTSLTVSFSAYGTYSSSRVGSNSGTQVMLGTWDWTDDSQTIIDIDGDSSLLNIISLTDTELVMQETNDEGATYIYSLSAL